MFGTRSGSLRREPFECQPGGFLPGRNHALDRHRTGHITRKRNSGMNEEIGVLKSGMVMRRINSTCLGMMRINAHGAQ